MSAKYPYALDLPGEQALEPSPHPCSGGQGRLVSQAGQPIYFVHVDDPFRAATTLAAGDVSVVELFEVLRFFDPSHGGDRSMPEPANKAGQRDASP